MLTVDDLKNLLVVLNRASYANLNEAKAGVLLEHKIRAEIQRQSAPPAEEV